MKVDPGYGKTRRSWKTDSLLHSRLRGRRLKGKGKGVSGARETRGARYIVDPFFVSSCDTSKDPVYLVPRSHSVLRWKVSPLVVGDLGTRLETRLDFRHLLGLPREAWQEETVRVRSAGTFPEQRLVFESSMKLNSDFSLHSLIFRTDPSFL